MAGGVVHRTLLERIVREGDHTVGEWCARFNETADVVGESASLSARQLQRWMSGETGRARPAMRRVAELVWHRPFADLVALAPRGAVRGAGPGASRWMPVPGMPLSGASLPGASLSGGSLSGRSLPGMSPSGMPLPGVVVERTMGEDEPFPMTPRQIREVAFMVAHESSHHAAGYGGGVGPETVEQVRAEVVRLARAYATTPPIVVLGEARQARDLAYAALDRTRRPGQTSDLYLSAGQLCVLMAWATFDLGVVDAADEQARAGAVYGELIDHPSLLALARGSQAAFAYWSGRARQATVHADAGVDIARSGMARAHLHSLQARAYAHLGGDSRRVTDALAAGDAALEAADGTDDLYEEIGGELGWGPAVHAACASSALLTMGDVPRAAERSRTALELVTAEDASGGLVPVASHLKLAQIELVNGALDAAQDALRPIWELPVSQRRHGEMLRMGDIAAALAGSYWRRDPAAAELRDRIETFTAQARARTLPRG